MTRISLLRTVGGLIFLLALRMAVFAHAQEPQKEIAALDAQNQAAATTQAPTLAAAAS